jgi:hypothetical protein
LVAPDDLLVSACGSPPFDEETPHAFPAALAASRGYSLDAASAWQAER